MSTLNLNEVVLAGHMTADVELKQTTSGVSVCSFGIAINRRPSAGHEPQTDFIQCQAWRQTAEFISRYFRRGSAICLTGSIQTRSWTDKQGQKRYETGVLVEKAMFVDSKNDAQGTSPANPVPSVQDQDDDLPF